MATWKVKNKTGGSLSGRIDYHDDNTSEWKLYQDEKPFLEQAKYEREISDAGLLKRDLGYKKFATIPDIVALAVNEKYGIDIHDDATMRDRDKMKKFKYIIQTEYAHLMSY